MVGLVPLLQHVPQSTIIIKTASLGSSHWLEGHNASVFDCISCLAWWQISYFMMKDHRPAFLGLFTHQQACIHTHTCMHTPPALTHVYTHSHIFKVFIKHLKSLETATWECHQEKNKSDAYIHTFTSKLCLFLCVCRQQSHAVKFFCTTTIRAHSQICVHHSN